MRKKINLAFLLLFLSYFCGINLEIIAAPKYKNKADSTLNIIAKKNFEVLEIEIRNDTLSVVSTNEFLWYPLGVFKNIESFCKAYKRTSVQKKACFYLPDTSEIIDSLFILKEGANSLIFYDEPLRYLGLRIIKGEINNNEIKLKENVTIGMSKTKFMQIFFDKVPENAIRNVKVIEFISGLDGMWLYFKFDKNILTKILFESYSNLSIKEKF